MPYNSNSDLPDSIKDALPEEAQTIFRKAFNSAYEQHGGDEEKSNATAWAAVKKAGWQKAEGSWVKKNQQLDIFAKTFDMEWEIFSVGKWNGDDYSEADLHDIVENFETLKDKIKPPVKLGHGWKEGQPALGWVESLSVVKDKIVAKITDIPEIIYEAINNKRYKRISSEIYWNFKAATGKTYNYVLKAVALLGADIPAVDNLQDLTAYLNQISNIGSFDKAVAYEFSTAYDTRAENAGDIKWYIKTKTQGAKKMSDEKVKKYEDEISSLKTKLETAENEAQESKSKVAKFEQDQEILTQKQRETEFKKFCEAEVKEGRMLPAERDRLFKQIPEFKYNEEGYLIPFVSFQSYVKNHIAILDTSEHGDAGGGSNEKKQYDSASAEIADRAKKVALDKDWDYEKAQKFVLADDPELAQRYRDEDLGE
jgi:cation transport regulator